MFGSLRENAPHLSYEELLTLLTEVELVLRQKAHIIARQEQIILDVEQERQALNRKRRLPADAGDRTTDTADSGRICDGDDTNGPVFAVGHRVEHNDGASVGAS